MLFLMLFQSILRKEKKNPKNLFFLLIVLHVVQCLPITKGSIVYSMNRTHLLIFPRRQLRPLHLFALVNKWTDQHDSDTNLIHSAPGRKQLSKLPGIELNRDNANGCQAAVGLTVAPWQRVVGTQRWLGGRFCGQTRWPLAGER